MGRTTVLRGDVTDEVTALKERPGGDIVTTGSISLVHALDHAGLVDEYRLFVYPVVLGQGRRLFEGPAEGSKLELAETHVHVRHRPVALQHRLSDRVTRWLPRAVPQWVSLGDAPHGRGGC